MLCCPSLDVGEGAVEDAAGREPVVPPRVAAIKRDAGLLLAVAVDRHLDLNMKGIKAKSKSLWVLNCSSGFQCRF